MKRFLYHNYRAFYLLQHWRMRRFTIGGTLLLIAIISSAVVGLDTHRTMAYQAFTFLSSLLTIAVIWSLFFRIRFKIHRHLPKFGTAGEPLEYRITIQNLTSKFQKGMVLFENLADPRPSYEEFIYTSEPEEERRNLFDQAMGFYRWQWLISRKQGIQIESQPLPGLMPGAKADIRIQIIPAHRGYLRFESVTIARPDPMGLFYAFATFPALNSLLILPRRYRLPLIRLPGTRRYQSGGIALSSSVGESEEFVSLREYRPGDSLRRIHWKSWAKTGKPVVKEFQDEYFVRHALILDTFAENPESSKANSDKYFHERFEAAVSVASSFACSVQTQESLLDLIFVGPEAYCFTAGRGLAHTDKILEILASVSLCMDKSFDTLAAMVLERAVMLSGCICILLTWDETRKVFLKRLKGMNMPVFVLLIADTSVTTSDLELMNEDSENFHILGVGDIQEGLAKL